MRLDDHVFLIDKPRGTSSFAAVRQLRRIARLPRVGHCGSLDPLATGLLILCTGAATRVTSLFMDLPKEYWARIVFGSSTDSYDADGRVTQEAPVPPLEAETIGAALRHFEGEIDQVPPMVSALKVGGRRLYELARRGEEIERAPRRVVVYALDLVDLGAEHADVRVQCGRGCYVRSLAHDLGQRLGIPAHLGSLRRGGIGPFRVQGAGRLESLEEWIDRGAPATEARRLGVRTLGEALSFLPALHLRRARETPVRNGVQPAIGFMRDAPKAAGTHVLLDEDGQRLIGLVEVEGRVEMPRLQLARIFQEPIATADPEND